MDTLHTNLVARGLDDSVARETCMRLATFSPPSSAITDELPDENPDGFGPVQEDGSQSSDEEAGCPAYWALDKCKVLHSTRSANCSWSPWRTRSPVMWFGSLAEGKRAVSGQCKRCFGDKTGSSTECSSSS